MSEFIFKPGSDLAIKNGCLCPVLDNAHGKGAYGVGEVYWINGECPLHGLRKGEETEMGYICLQPEKMCINQVGRIPQTLAYCEGRVPRCCYLEEVLANDKDGSEKKD